MSTFATTDYVCLASPQQIQAKRQAQASWDRGYLREPLWRQIAISADAHHVVLRLGNVSEDAASGGYCGCWYNSRTLTLTWDDILDRDGLANLFQYEQVCVFEKVNSMLEIFREHMRALRSALAA